MSHILHDLAAEGQAVWLDFISRKILENGELAALVGAGLRGVTSNPSIFASAITSGADYDADLRAHLAANPGASATDLYEALTVEDVRRACDALRSVYERTAGADGFVSLEVSPLLAHDTAGTLAEARRLWAAVARPNLMIKVPGTAEGVPAIDALTADGIHVNVTLLFSLSQYEAIARAFIRGLGKAKEPSKAASVASFFVSRLDTVVDKALAAKGSAEAKALLGKAAVANAKRAYALYQQLFAEPEFAALRARGARPQRPLWASTGTKNPAYSDLLYVETLVGPDTVNTIPPATLAALRDHGKVARTLDAGVADADAALAALPRFGIDLNAETEALQKDGVELFAKAYRDLIASLERKRRAMLADALAPATYALGKAQASVDAVVGRFTEARFEERLFAKDGTLWSQTPVPELTDRLGWLELAAIDDARVAELRAFAEEIRGDGYQHAVLLGMGGSSLAPEVFQHVFGARDGYPVLTVLDTTHPDAVHTAAARLDLERSLFLVSSKSGSTIESNSLYQFFWDALAKLGPARGRRFVAITDPGSSLEKLARARGFRRVVASPPEVGGRYSALSVFGLVPAALIGVDVARLVRRAGIMADACGAPGTPRADRDAAKNPGLVLGAALGVLAKEGRDKLTFVTPSALAAFPCWVEQLVAESTGKNGVGILPIDGEALGGPEVYGADRVFVALTLSGERDGGEGEREAKLRALEAAGHPVIRIALASAYDLGQELFRWEVATAAAGAHLGIQPFDQPDVQLAKTLARRAMERAGQGGGAVPTVDGRSPQALREALQPLLARVKKGDYLAIHAYLAPSAELTAALEGLRVGLRNQLRVATTLGYGPRFLHSTGQLHKGGGDGGVFLQILDTPARDAAIPETDFSFGRLIRAQADGDVEALAQRGRRLARVELGGRGDAEAIRRLAEILASIVA